MMAFRMGQWVRFPRPSRAQVRSTTGPGRYLNCIENWKIPIHTRVWIHYHVCSGSVVATAYDSESGRPGSSPEWGLIYYEASITAQGLPEPSSLRSSTLGTRAAEQKGCNWGMQVD